MSTRARISLIVLNILCVPVNIWSITRAIHLLQTGDWFGGITLMVLAVFFLVWCSFIAFIHTSTLIKAKQNERRNLRF